MAGLVMVVISCFPLHCASGSSVRGRYAGAFLSLLINMPQMWPWLPGQGAPRAGSGRAVSLCTQAPRAADGCAGGPGHLSRSPGWDPMDPHRISTLRGLSIRVSSFVNNGLMTVTLQMNTKWLTCSWAVVSEAEESHLLPHSWFLLLVWTDVSQSSATV